MNHKKTPVRSSPLASTTRLTVTEQPRANNSTFRAVEGTLRRLLVHQVAKYKVTAPSTGACNSNTLPTISVSFLCADCKAFVCMPSQSKTSCRAHCLRCCRCPTPRDAV